MNLGSVRIAACFFLSCACSGCALFDLPEPRTRESKPRTCEFVAHCRGPTAVDPRSDACEGDSAQIVPDPCAPHRDALCCLDEPCCPAGSEEVEMDAPGAVEIGCGEGAVWCRPSASCGCTGDDVPTTEEECSLEEPCYQLVCFDGVVITCRARS